MDWYYARGVEQVGPVSGEEFQALIARGEIAPDTLVWHEGMTDWQAFSEVERQAAVPLPTSDSEESVYTQPASDGSLPCTACGRYFQAQDLVTYEGRYICAECKPLYFQRLREGAPAGFVSYGGFWIRFVATIIDGFLMTIGHFAILFLYIAVTTPDFAGGESEAASGWLMQVGQYLWSFGYETWFTGKFGATPGKMAVGLKVVRSDGSRVTYLRALGRCFAKYLSYLLLLIGFIMVAFDEQKRGLHDYICDTRVIRK